MVVAFVFLCPSHPMPIAQNLPARTATCDPGVAICGWPQKTAQLGRLDVCVGSILSDWQGDDQGYAYFVYS